MKRLPFIALALILYGVAGVLIADFSATPGNQFFEAYAAGNGFALGTVALLVAFSL